MHNYEKIKIFDKMPPKTSTYVKIYDVETTWMNFLIKDDDFLENEEEDTNFQNIETRIVDCNHYCLTVISLDSALKIDENYYTQVFLKESK